jgi:PAS domain S-box-containing protein
VDAPSRSSPARNRIKPVEIDALRLLVESTVDYAIFMLDVGGYVATWNRGAQRIKGYAAEEIIGQHFSVFYPEEAVARDWPAYELKEAARVGRFEDEGWRVRKGGSQFWANVVITALRDHTGQLQGFGKVTRDLTERRAHEQRVQQLTVELEQRVRDLAAANLELRDKSAENESFVYSVSHDLRSPLVNLQGFSHELKLTSEELAVLLSDSRVPADIQQRALYLLRNELAESTGFISNAVRHLSSIIDGLLRLSRVGRIEYRLEPVDMNALATDIVAAMHSTVVTSGATVKIAPLPTILADGNAAGQVFANLLGNALKSLDAGRPGLVEIAATDDEPPVFSIRDNGIGIPQESQARLFDTFQQGPPRGQQGEGMGLAIVKRIVERHGGRLWFESTPGSGTTFFFVLGPAAALDPGGSATGGA